MEDSRFHANTVILADRCVAFVDDLVDFMHPSYGGVMGKLLHLFQKVHV